MFCGESGLGKTRMKDRAAEIMNMVYDRLKEWWQTLDEDEFGKFDEARWCVMFSVSRLKATYLVIHSKKGYGLLVMNETS